jgi:hypothetical protein
MMKMLLESNVRTDVVFYFGDDGVGGLWKEGQGTALSAEREINFPERFIPPSVRARPSLH